MDDPIAYFITVVTYGTWLPGDSRGWVEYQGGWHPPDPVRLAESAARMSRDATWLNAEQRTIVEGQVRQTCSVRKWQCHAVNCRSNHLHVVVSAQGVKPKKIRRDLKSWCTRRLREHAGFGADSSWLAERGSIRWIFDEDSLERVVIYTLDGQEKQGAEGFRDAGKPR